MRILAPYLELIPINKYIHSASELIVLCPPIFIPRKNLIKTESRSLLGHLRVIYGRQ